MNYVIAIFKRELNAYFITPVAYVFIVIFLVLNGLCTFYLGNFYERGQADLEPFFEFGDGNTAKKFQKILRLPKFWERDIQKSFVRR